MNLEQRIIAFVELGKFLSQYSSKRTEKNVEIKENQLFYNEFIEQMKIAQHHNEWFNEDNIKFTITYWSKSLIYSNIKSWLEKYNLKDITPRKVAIIMAGNIPLVGFHDFLSVLITGHHVLIKQSSNDNDLLPFIVRYLKHIEPQFTSKIEFTDGKLENFDAVIATGSNNTARYFEYYFKDKPSIIRKNRNSVAILSGNETEEQLIALSEDVFRYYGLGCRNVSKLFVPKDYNFDKFYNAMYHWHPLINENKYSNNYDYNKAVYLMSEFDLFDNGFLMLKHDKSYASPIATLFYEFYNTKEELKEKLELEKENIQCIVANNFDDNETNFGMTQKPGLWQYADEVDTVDFLLKI